jgi:hypothetical protein
MASMNRHKANGLDRVAAVHEAGHAMARYLSADAMGFHTDEAIDYIEIVPPYSRPSLDAKTILVPEAATVGPVYSRPMMDFLKADPISQNLTAAVEACKAHGIDVEMWATVQTFVCMAGAAAEAQFTNRSLREIANGYQWESDLSDATRYCLAAGMTRQEASKACNNALIWAREVFDDPQNWTAVLALADKLPSGGRIDGRRIEKIITQAMHGDAGGNLMAVRQTRDDAVFAICERVAKVQALLHDHLDGGKHTAATIVAKAQAVLSEPELRRAMFDVGYFPPNTPPDQ